MDETGVLLSVLNFLKVLVGKSELRNYRGAGVKRALVTAQLNSRAHNYVTLTSKTYCLCGAHSALGGVLVRVVLCWFESSRL
jgi:hypothetical protein